MGFSSSSSSLNMKNLLWVLISLIILFPAVVFGECTCDLEEEEDGNKNLALKYKLAAFAAILAAGAVGVCLPVAGRTVAALSPEKNFFFVLKAFAAGVILSTGFIHVLPDAFESLTSPCIGESPWGDFPFTGFIAMVAAIGTLMVDTYATSYYGRRAVKDSAAVKGEEAGVVPVHTHGHSHGSVTLESGETEQLRHRVISQVLNLGIFTKILELGIIVHSVIIGIALGASQSPNTIRPLIAALSFHQFFEGIGLGGCITQAKFNARAVTIMVTFFSLTTPIGIVIGIGITNVYSETSPAFNCTRGFQLKDRQESDIHGVGRPSCGDFMSPKMQSNSKLRLWANLFFFWVFGCMSLLAKWA
ncbi:hypothetical protein DH2020_022755 [Rehmannia glutinosa]|uniref:Uncharacterized protein n=1 Tax=Rehmannia glutinosa TaxID=99300 RepID=A0ABR0W7Y9_REHGL